MMRGIVGFCCLLLILQIVSWAGVTSRPLPPNEAHVVPQPGTEEEGKFYKGVNKIGSRPPSCEDKCYGCMPCEAIQVPTTTARIGVQYTNYEPEGWRCKCGPSFYTP